MSETLDPSNVSIPEWEQEIIHLFVGIFDGLGLPKSTAMIYGTLYCAEEGMLQEEIIQRLRISAGSASQGLKLLQNVGAVTRQSPIGRRHSLYSAERSMRRLVGSLVDSQLRPKLRNGRERLDHLAREVPESEERAHQRIQTLLSWQKKVERGMPLLNKIFSVPPRIEE